MPAVVEVGVFAYSQVTERPSAASVSVRDSVVTPQPGKSTNPSASASLLVTPGVSGFGEAPVRRALPSSRVNGPPSSGATAPEAALASISLQFDWPLTPMPLVLRVTVARARRSFAVPKLTAFSVTRRSELPHHDVPGPPRLRGSVPDVTHGVVLTVVVPGVSQSRRAVMKLWLLKTSVVVVEAVVVPAGEITRAVIECGPFGKRGAPVASSCAVSNEQTSSTPAASISISPVAVKLCEHTTTVPSTTVSTRLI